MTEPDALTPKLPPGQDELPCEDGEPMDTPRHRVQMNLLIDSLEEAWQSRNDYYVGGNMFVYFSELQVKKNDFRGPDVFVVLDTTWRHRKSWVAWEEGGKLPDVVIELTSPSTARIDHEDKKRLYANVWRCPEYFIFDPETEELHAYRLDVETRNYLPVPPDARGDYPVAGLQLRLGLRPGKISVYEGNFLRWIDAPVNRCPCPASSLPTSASEPSRSVSEPSRSVSGPSRSVSGPSRSASEPTLSARVPTKPSVGCVSSRRSSIRANAESGHAERVARW